MSIVQVKPNYLEIQMLTLHNDVHHIKLPASLDSEI
jgi:hypothetical protein